MTVSLINGQHTGGRPASSINTAPSLLQLTPALKPSVCQHLRFKASRSSAQRFPAHNAQGYKKRQPEPEFNRRGLLLAGNALFLAATCPCCMPKADAAESGAFSYAADATGPSAWPGVCTIGMQQSPINIPLTEHLAAQKRDGGNSGRKVGDIKLQYSQQLSDVGELSFDFVQELKSSGDIKFNFEQNVEKFGSIRFRLDQKFEQKMDRFGDIKFQYNHQTDATIKNTGHGTMQVNVPKGNFSQVAGRELELVQWHFHTPSEHAFDGNRKSIEAHLVHKDTKTGELAVVGVLLQEGPSEPNPALQFALRLAPEAAGEEQAATGQSMQIDTILPRPNEGGHRPYIHYVGSLTTPPCSEAVQWFVMTETVTIPSSQVVQFQEFAGKTNPGVRANARPLQPLMGRSLDYQYL
ncbi:hypothetical protein ABBQ38_006101 [Trebouxia sp. C0009 RCD-2024]